jgi:4-amino-4-deoxy-L-arabinose transferase-like glycosyltransferase
MSQQARLPPSGAANGQANLALAGLAAVYFLLTWLPGVWIGESGYFIDELYYIACSKRLAFGYVDHPPLSILLLRLIQGIGGSSLAVLRLLPAAAGAATVLLTGVLARRLGASVVGQVIAALAVMVSVPYQVIFSFFSMNAIEILLWALCFYLLVEIERRHQPRLWLLVGVVFGVGLQNKHTVALLGGALAAAMLLTAARRHLMSRWLWAGVGVALLLALPNLAWQAANDWPSLEFYRNQDLLKNVATPPLEVLKLQVLAMNPGALPVWLAGLGFLLVSRPGAPYRHLAWTYLVLLALLVIGGKSRPDRIGAAYVMLFAAGGAWLGERISRHRWLQVPVLGTLICFGVALVPVGLPLLPAPLTAAYVQFLGIVPQIERGAGKRAVLPQWQADRYDWPLLVDDVERVYRSLPESERAGAVIFAASYGDAGAIELWGPARGLPPVYATHNNYFLWGPPPVSPEVVLVVSPPVPGSDPPAAPADLRDLFEEVVLGAQHRCNWCLAWRRGLAIWIARHPRIDLRLQWKGLKRFV